MRTLLLVILAWTVHLCGGEATTNTAIVPVPKLEQDGYDWYARHEAVLKAVQGADPEVVMIGDSITHFWGGDPPGPNHGPEAWKAAFADRRVLNLGFGWDRTQNVLWRLDHGEFTGLHPHWVVLMIGTNNLTGTANARENTPAEIVAGIAAISRQIGALSPKTRIVHMAVLPRGRKADDPFRAKIASVNRLLAAYAAQEHHAFIDLGAQLVDAAGTIPAELMGDACHPTDKGYAVWAAALRAEFAKSP
ncbi:MAG: acetylhydrolase [Planctomycetes bacterium]|nr:acetylhydrolase [Planctomycetota bacterium]